MQVSTSTCLTVWLSGCLALFGCLSGWLAGLLCVCPFVCLPTCLPAHLSACLSVRLFIYLPTYLSVCLSVCLSLSICQLVCIGLFMDTNIHSRGALKYHTKSYSSAIEDFTTAINMDPSHASLAHFNRALCHQATGELEKVCVTYNWCRVTGLHDHKPHLSLSRQTHCTSTHTVTHREDTVSGS